MVSAGNANGPGSTDGAKLSLRGAADGTFNITYDGITWGDTNGPSHHANSFFPNSTIGGAVIDRSPGTALDIGQASFGGTLNLYSLPVEDHFAIRQKVTVGSWDTWQSVTTVATGPIAQAHDLNLIMNLQEYGTNGFLSYSPSAGDNQYIKAVMPLTSKITLTGLFTRNDDHYNLSDIGTGTVAEDAKYNGINFGLCNDPNYSCYKGYNYTKKATDFEYLKEAGEIAHGLTFDNTTYSFWYSNRTLSANNQDWSTLPGTAGSFANIALSPPTTYPSPGKADTKGLVPGLPGYWKRNEYRVTGDVVRFNEDLGFGKLTVGGLYEVAKTKRFIDDIALPTPGSGISGYNTPIYSVEKAGALPITGSAMGCDGYTQLNASPYNGICATPLNVRYNEYSGWYYYQMFGQFAWRVTDKWTVTPGVKYLNFDLYVHAPVEQTVTQPVFVEKTFDKTLGFLSTNYRLTSYWSAYGQIAQGFLVPNIGSLYVYNENYGSVQPQQDMAYQLGTVYSRGPINFDADVYDIVFQHKLQSVTPVGSSDTFYTNSGGADYKGFEGELTYVFARGASIFVNYSNNVATGKNDPYNPGGNGRQLALAPRWTGAAGFRYERGNIITNGDDFIFTFDNKWVGPQMATAASGTSVASSSYYPTGLIKTYPLADLGATYRWDRFAVELQLINLANKQYLTGGKFKAYVGDLPALTVASGGGANTPQYMTPMSYQFTFKVAF
jgi:iron complex outermembrane receptor protein